MIKKLLILLLCILFLGCGVDKKKIVLDKKKVLIEMGFDSMTTDRIIPEILEYKDSGIWSILEVNIPNSFIIVDGGLNYALVKINSDFSFETTTFKLDSVSGGGDEFFSDNEHNVLWTKEGRKFVAFDLETKRTGNIVVSHDGDDVIGEAILVDPEKKLFAIEIITAAMDLENIHARFILFDLNNNKSLFQSNPYDGTILPFSKSIILWDKQIRNKTRSYYSEIWQFTDLQLNKLPDNKLTDSLTKNNISIETRNAKPYHFVKRIMIGNTEIDDDFINYSIRWDKDLKEVKIEPLTIQIPPYYSLSNLFWISADGNWVKTTASPKSNYKREEIVFLQVNDTYPQGLSFPILGGISDRRAPGAFVNHTELGPLYVEMNREHDRIVMVYKLNDGLNYLKSKGLK